MKERATGLWVSVLGLCILVAFSPFTMAQGGPQPAGASLADKIPSKWFLKAKGYEEALELQKQTGADIFIYFTREAPASDKGLCRWFENKALGDVKMRKFLREYIKVHVPLPSNPDSQRLAEQFQVGKTPAVYIVQPNRRPQLVKVFDWSEGRPKLDPVETIIETCRVRSSLRYQLPAGESTPAQP